VALPVDQPNTLPPPRGDASPKNIVHLAQAVSQFFTHARQRAEPRLIPIKWYIRLGEILNNPSWWNDVSSLGFPWDVGAYGRMSAMPTRDKCRSLDISDPYNLTNTLVF
jgi:hypothetical protein